MSGGESARAVLREYSVNYIFADIEGRGRDGSEDTSTRCK